MPVRMDIMLADNDCLMIPDQISDVFISHFQEQTQEMLKETKKNLQEEIYVRESRVELIQGLLANSIIYKIWEQHKS